MSIKTVSVLMVISVGLIGCAGNQPSTHSGGRESPQLASGNEITGGVFGAKVGAIFQLGATYNISNSEGVTISPNRSKQ